jgi:hypothetical protein
MSVVRIVMPKLSQIQAGRRDMNGLLLNVFSIDGTIGGGRGRLLPPACMLRSWTRYTQLSMKTMYLLRKRRGDEGG